jgi:transketolase
MRSIANMTVVSPSDPITTRKAVHAIAAYDGPVFMRLGRQEAVCIHDEDISFELGRMILMRPGRDLTIIATGHMAAEALSAAEDLASAGIDVRVLDCHTIKPIDRAKIVAAAEETAGIVTVEDHNVLGGLGSAVAEVAAETRPTRVYRVGLKDQFASSGRDYRRLLAAYEIDAAAIVRQSRRLLEDSIR